MFYEVAVSAGVSDQCVVLSSVSLVGADKFALGDVFVFFFKQKTAYEMRISDWSSDVCSSDLSSPPGPSRTGSRRWKMCAPRASTCAAAGSSAWEIGRASCRERVCQYV